MDVVTNKNRHPPWSSPTYDLLASIEVSAKPLDQPRSPVTFGWPEGHESLSSVLLCGYDVRASHRTPARSQVRD